MLGLRLLLGVPLFFVMIGVLCFDAYYRVGWGLCAMLAIFAIFGVREFCRFAEVAGKKPFTKLAMIFVALLFIATELNLRALTSLNLELLVFIIFISGVFLLQLFYHGNRQPFDNISATLLTLTYFWFFLSFLLRIRHLEVRHGWAYDGVELMFVFFTATKICDIAGLIIGKRFGYHKISPIISPKKSWEGFFGGMFAGVALLAIVIYLHPNSALAHFGYARVLPLGILLSIFGLFGDLCESAFKREAQMKDAGGALPGYGGAMDLLDSLTFNAPIAYYYFVYVGGAY